MADVVLVVYRSIKKQINGEKVSESDKKGIVFQAFLWLIKGQSLTLLKNIETA